MSGDGLIKLAEIAKQMRDRELAAYATARTRREAAQAHEAALIAKLQVESHRLSGCADIALKIAEAGWQRQAGQSLASLQEKAQDQRAIEEQARRAAATALGRCNSIELLREKHAEEALARQSRREERDGTGLAT